MRNWDEETLQDFVQRFQLAEIPLEAWAPHTSHLAVSTVVCRLHPTDALERMRAGILALNAANNITGRYHETVTRFYVDRILELVGLIDRGQPNAELVNEVIRRLGGTREEREAIWLRYYNDIGFLWTDPAARERWFPPDKHPA
jgi:hypothetical protein